jgi:hypothetical protein
MGPVIRAMLLEGELVKWGEVQRFADDGRVLL